MRHVLLPVLLALTCLSSMRVTASCIERRLSVFPHRRYIGATTMFVIEGYGHIQPVVAELNKHYPVYLQSAGERVPIRVTDVLVGQHNLTQAILVPETELVVGRDYDLVIDGLPDSVRHEQLDSTDRTWITASYTVVAERDTQPPRVAAKPAVIIAPSDPPGPRRYIEFPISHWVHFSYGAQDASEIIVKATMKSLKTGRETTYFIEPEGTTIAVGNDYCGGAFAFNEGDDYEIMFSCIDSAGNSTPANSEWITFTIPENIRMTR